MEFLEKFKTMAPMRYYENDLDLPKAQEMIANKDNQFFAMRKYDGEWCRAIIGEDEVLLQSRSISRVTGKYGDKTLNVPHIVAELKKFFPPDTVLLGELAFDDYESTSRNVGSIMRSLPARAISLQKDKKLHFFIFDVLAYNGKDLMDLSFEERFKYLDIDLSHLDYINIVESRKNNFLDFADEIWQKGGEGAMIVRKDMKYSPGSRTAWKTLKVKKKLGNLELPVVDFIEPNKAYEGDAPDNWLYWVDKNDRRLETNEIFNMRDLGPIMPVTRPYYYRWKNGVVVNYKGNLVRVTSGMTDKDREYMASPEAAELLKQGKLTAIITGMEKTEKSIRHPVFIGLKDQN